jgi:uncharacterized protein (UPF0248 family)
MKLSWHLATERQLYEIAYNDTGARLADKLQAAEEIERRKKKFVVNHKRKKVVLG